MIFWRSLLFLFFFFNDTATTEIYTLSLHDALPICRRLDGWVRGSTDPPPIAPGPGCGCPAFDTTLQCQPGLFQADRSEEHTSELQSRLHLVCRLLLEKKNTIDKSHYYREINYNIYH